MQALTKASLLALLGLGLCLPARATEEFQFTKSFIEAMSLYKTSDDALWPETLRSTGTDRMDPSELLQAYRVPLYRQSLQLLDKANEQLSPFVMSKREEINQGAKGFLSVTQMARSVYQAEMEMVENISVKNQAIDKNAAVHVLAQDHNDGRVKRVSALIVATAFVNKALQSEKPQGPLKLEESERKELIALINKEFPRTQEAIALAGHAQTSMDSSMVFILPLLEKNKGFVKSPAPAKK